MIVLYNVVFRSLGYGDNVVSPASRPWNEHPTAEIFERRKKFWILFKEDVGYGSHRLAVTKWRDNELGMEYIKLPALELKWKR